MSASGSKLPFASKPISAELRREVVQGNCEMRKSTSHQSRMVGVHSQEWKQTHKIEVVLGKLFQAEFNLGKLQ